jgi:hypothetical protein
MAKPVLSSPSSLVPLAQETRLYLPTPEAALHLCRASQTLRMWASQENGPIRPTRVHGRLLWRTDEIRQLLGVKEATT